MQKKKTRGEQKVTIKMKSIYTDQRTCNYCGRLMANSKKPQKDNMCASCKIKSRKYKLIKMDW